MTIIYQPYETLIFVLTPQFGCKGHKYPDNSERRRIEAHPHSGQWQWHQGKPLIFTPHTSIDIGEMPNFLFAACCIFMLHRKMIWK